MQRCKNCLTKLKWKEVFFSILLGYKSIECNKCNAKYYLPYRYRLIFASIFTLPIFLADYIYKLYNTASFVISIFVMWFIIWPLIAPFFLRYHQKFYLTPNSFWFIWMNWYCANLFPSQRMPLLFLRMHFPFGLQQVLYAGV